MKIMIRPMQDSLTQVDVTHRVVSAIAHELWERYGGNEQLNWLEAESHVRRLLDTHDSAAMRHAVLEPEKLDSSFFENTKVPKSVRRRRRVGAEPGLALAS